jgi:hypothetical protein
LSHALTIKKKGKKVCSRTSLQLSLQSHSVQRSAMSQLESSHLFSRLTLWGDWNKWEMTWAKKGRNGWTHGPPHHPRGVAVLWAVFLDLK